MENQKIKDVIAIVVTMQAAEKVIAKLEDSETVIQVGEKGGDMLFTSETFDQLKPLLSGIVKEMQNQKWNDLAAMFNDGSPYQ